MKLLLAFVSLTNLAIGVFWAYLAGATLLAGELRPGSESFPLTTGMYLALTTVAIAGAVIALASILIWRRCAACAYALLIGLGVMAILLLVESAGIYWAVGHVDWSTHARGPAVIAWALFTGWALRRLGKI